VTNPSKRLAALGLSAAFVLAACGGGSSPSPSSGASSGASSEPSAAGPTPPECLSFADIYALMGPESEGFGNWTDAQAIATELGSSTGFPDLPLSVTAPGEESGTFDSFVEIVDFPGVGEERGAPPNVDSDNDGTLDDWSTRADYVGQPNDNAIIAGIGGAAGSFGWVGFAFYEENLDTVRAFTIAEEPGGTCIEPTAETIATNEYPISRDLFIYVNKAKAEDNPAIVAYVDYYLADGTIDGVLQTVPYVPLAAEVLADTQSTWTDFKGSMTADPAGSIFVSGSSTVEPISGQVAKDFKAANSGFDYTVEGPGTGDGFSKFCNGETDISDASRPIRDNEIADCQTAGIEYVELKVAIDGIAVMTKK
jgi:ABC-type phosphate transport system substrate-binding protein